MAETTAYIHIGPLARGQFAGRAPVPTHVLYLSEGSRPILRLVPTDPAGAEQLVSWVPRDPTTILADALVMIAALVVGDRATNQTLGRIDALHFAAGPYELPAAAALAVGPACLALRTASIVVAVCAGSSLQTQLDVLNDVAGEVEVLTSSYLAYDSSAGRIARGQLGPGAF